MLPHFPPTPFTHLVLERSGQVAQVAVLDDLRENVWGAGVKRRKVWGGERGRGSVEASAPGG